MQCSQKFHHGPFFFSNLNNGPLSDGLNVPITVLNIFIHFHDHGCLHVLTRFTNSLQCQSHFSSSSLSRCARPRISAGKQSPTPSSSTNFAPPSDTQKRSVGWLPHPHHAHYRVRPHQPALAHQHQGREVMRPLDTWIARPVIRATNTNAISNG